MASKQANNYFKAKKTNKSAKISIMDQILNLG